jgi:hypothetical protein
MIVEIQYKVYNAYSKHDIFSKDVRFNQFRRYEWAGYSFYTVTEFLCEKNHTISLEFRNILTSYKISRI